MARNGVTVACSIRSLRLAGNPDSTDGHTESCLRCQAEAVRYRILLRHLAALGSETVLAPPALLSLVTAGLGMELDGPKKGARIETAMAAAGIAAVAGALALWRRTQSA